MADFDGENPDLRAILEQLLQATGAAGARGGMRTQGPTNSTGGSFRNSGSRNLPAVAPANASDAFSGSGSSSRAVPMGQATGSSNRTVPLGQGEDKPNIWEALAEYGPQAWDKVKPKGAPDTYVPQYRSGTALPEISKGFSSIRQSMLDQQPTNRAAEIGQRSADIGIGIDQGTKQGGAAAGFGGMKAIMDSMRGIASGGQQSQSPGDSYIDQMLQQMMGGGGGGAMPDMPDAGQMAEEQFAPQFDLLDSLRGQTTERYNTAGTDTRAMYDALANQIRQEATGTVERYDSSGEQMREIGQNAISNVEGTAANSNAEMEAIMRRLGTGAAAPDALGNIAETTQRSVGSIAGNNAAFEQANEQLGQNQADYQENTANTTGVAGANAQADWTSRLGEALGGYDNKELELTGAQKQAENEYMMQIQEMLGQHQNAQSGNQMKALEMMMGREGDMFDRQMQMNEFGMDQQRFGLDEFIAGNTQENNRAQREMDAARFEAEQRAAANQVQEEPDWGINTPGQVMNEAMRLFGNHPANAQSGTDIVSQAFRDANGDPNMAMQNIEEEFRDSPYLRRYLALAQIYANANG